MTPATARATQQALDDALQPAADPVVIESDTEFAWRQWDAARRAQDQQRNQLHLAAARRLNRLRTDAPLTGFGGL